MLICEDKQYTKRVWVAVALSILRAMREAREQDKVNTVPTPFYLLIFSKGNGEEYIIIYGII